MKKLIAICLICLVILSLNGCNHLYEETESTSDGTAPSGSEEKNDSAFFDQTEKNQKTLSVFIGDHFKKYSSIEALTQTFSLQNNISISYYDKPYDGMFTDFLTGGGPDVIVAECGLDNRPINYSSLLQSAMQRGYFLDLKSFMEETPSLSGNNVYKNLLTAGQYEGKQYLFPFEFHLPFLICPKATEEKYQLKLRDGMTFEELLEACEQPLSEGKYLSSNFALLLKEYLMSSDTPVIDYEQKKSYATEELFYKAAKAYRFLDEECLRYFDERKGSVLEYFTYTTLKEGNALCYIGTNLYGGELSQMQSYFNANGMELSVYEGLRIKEGALIAMPGSVMGISARCKEQQAAWDYLKYLLETYKTDTRFTTPEKETASFDFDALSNSG